MKKIFTSIVLCTLAMLGFNTNAACYLVGEVNGNNWSPTVGVELQQTDTEGVYQGEATMSGNTFAVASQLMETDDWGTFNSEYRYGPETDQTPLQAGTVASMKKGGQAWSLGKGDKYTFTVDMNNLTVKAEKIEMPTRYTMVGTFNAWNLNTNNFENQGDGVWTLSLDKLKGDFKIARGSSEVFDWSNVVTWGTNGNEIAVGENYAPTFNAGDNILLAGSNDGVEYKNVTVTLTDNGDNNIQLLVAGENGDAKITYEIVGESFGWSLGADENMFEEKEPGIYTYKANKLSGRFKIIKNGSWSTGYGSNGSDLIIGQDYELANADEGDIYLKSLRVYNDVLFTLDLTGEKAVLRTTTDKETVANDKTYFYSMAGFFNSWSLEANQFTKVEDGVYEMQLETLSGDFKIVRNETEAFNWDNTWGTNGNKLVVGETYLAGRGADNIEIDGDGIEYKNVKVKITEGDNGFEILITGDSGQAEKVIYYSMTGSFNNWSLEANQFTKVEDGVYEMELETLSGEFKIVRNETLAFNWDNTWGSNGSNLVVGQDYQATFNGNNITIDGEDVEYKDVKVRITEGDESLTILVSGEPVSLLSWELTGDFNGWELGKNYFEQTAEPGIYTLDLDEFEGGFKVIKNKTWAGSYCSNGSELMLDQKYELVAGDGGENVVVSGGKYEFVRFLLDTTGENVAITMTGVAGIDNVELGENADVQYFNLQGVRVANPEKGMYIVKRGSKIQKEIVR